MEILHDVGPLFTSSQDEVKGWLLLAAMRASAGEIIAQKKFLERLKTDFRKEYIGRTVAYAQVLFPLGIDRQAVGI